MDLKINSTTTVEISVKELAKILAPVLSQSAGIGHVSPDDIRIGFETMQAGPQHDSYITEKGLKVTIRRS